MPDDDVFPAVGDTLVPAITYALLSSPSTLPVDCIAML
jgi:hypothetical protein